MSQTTRRAQARSRAQAAELNMEESAERVEDFARMAANGADEMAGGVAETVSRTADAAVDITQRVADQGREVMWLGMRAAAGMNGRLADVSYGNSHRLLQQAARVADIYGHASEAAADNLRALFASCLSLGHGMQQMQHVWLNMLDRSVNEAVHKPQDLLRCKSLVEFANTQRELYVDAIDSAMDASAALLQTAERAARSAMGPLQGRARGTND